MVRVEDVEELSRLLAGELPAEPRARLEARLRDEPELFAAWESLRALEGQLAQLPLTVSEQTLERVMPPAAPTVRSPRRWRAALAVGGLVAAAALALFVLRGAPSREVARLRVLEGVAVLDGSERAKGTEHPFGPGATLSIPAKGAATLTQGASLVRLTEGATLRWEVDASAPELTAGLLLASGEPARISAGGAELEIHGDAVIAMEPDEALDRVTEALSPSSSGESPMTRLKPLVSKGLPRTGAAVATFALWVTAGHAFAQPTIGPAVQISEGEAWRAGDAHARPVLVADAATAQRTREAPLAVAPVNANELESVRAERDALRAENQALKATLAQLREQDAARERASGVADQGTPMKAPPHVDARFQSDALLANINRALKEAGYAQGQVTSIDCSEYPCIVYGEGMGSRAEFEVLARAPSWEPYRHDSAQKFGWHGNGVSRFAVALTADNDGTDQGELTKRLRFRASQMEATFPANLRPPGK